LIECILCTLAAPLATAAAERARKLPTDSAPEHCIALHCKHRVSISTLQQTRRKDSAHCRLSIISSNKHKRPRTHPLHTCKAQRLSRSAAAHVLSF
jgi:hypothetical protein